MISHLPKDDDPVTLKEACEIMFRNRISPTTLRAEATRERVERLGGISRHHKIVVGTSNGLFSSVGDVRAGRVQIVHPSGREGHEILKETGSRQTERGSLYMANVGKKTAGRLLDGREHNEFPAR